jgi:hypothetical protein
LIQAGGKTLRSEINKLVNSVWKKEKLSGPWKDSIIASDYKKDDITDSRNCRGISMLLTTYKILSSIFLSRPSPYVDEIIEDHRCEILRNKSATDHIFYVRRLLEKKREYNEAVRQLFTDFKTAHDSVRREMLYNVLAVFGIPTNRVRLNKM